MTIKIKRTLTILLDSESCIDNQIIDLANYSIKIYENSKNIDEIILVCDNLKIVYNMSSTVNIYCLDKEVDIFSLENKFNDRDNMLNFLNCFSNGDHFEDLRSYIEHYSY